MEKQVESLFEEFQQKSGDHLENFEKSALKVALIYTLEYEEAKSSCPQRSPHPIRVI